MPTSRKRIGFLPRPEVQTILDDLSIEENLSQSKVVGILVEEALNYRGLFDKKNGKRFLGNPHDHHLSQSLMKGVSTENLELIDELRKDNPSARIELVQRKKRSDNRDEMLEKFAQFLKFQEIMENY